MTTECAIIRWPDKDPDEKLDYVINWADRLASGDTIDTSVWTVPDGIDESDAGKTDTTTYLWLEGGTAGNTYKLTNKVTTQVGRVHEQSVTIRVVEQ